MHAQEQNSFRDYCYLQYAKGPIEADDPKG